MLSDNGCDIVNDVLKTSLTNPNTKSNPWSRPVNPVVHVIDRMSIKVNTTKVVNWDIEKSNHRAVFAVLLQENHLGETKFNN